MSCGKHIRSMGATPWMMRLGLEVGVGQRWCECNCPMLSSRRSPATSGPQIGPLGPKHPLAGRVALQPLEFVVSGDASVDQLHRAELRKDVMELGDAVRERLDGALHVSKLPVCLACRRLWEDLPLTNASDHSRQQKQPSGSKRIAVGR